MYLYICGKLAENLRALCAMMARLKRKKCGGGEGDGGEGRGKIGSLEI